MQDYSEYWMKRSLELVGSNWGRTNPNPCVGAVVVANGEEVASGVTQVSGGPHAERMALKEAAGQAKGADLFVTLEPCSHYGKNPPCIEAIKEAGIARVFVAVSDPNPLVNGKGIAKLREWGIEVFEDICRAEATDLYKGFFCYIQKQRPFVTVKIAQTLNGVVGGADGCRMRITSPETQKWVHNLRRRVNLVLVGGGTLVCDDPKLDVRHSNDNFGSAPLKGVFSTRSEISAELNISHNEGKEWLWCGPEIPSQIPDAQHILLQERDSNLAWNQLLLELGRMGMHHILVEAGPKMAQIILENGTWDELIVLTAPKIEANGQKWWLEGPSNWVDSGELSKFAPIGTDWMVQFRNKNQK